MQWAFGIAGRLKTTLIRHETADAFQKTRIYSASKALGFRGTHFGQSNAVGGALRLLPALNDMILSGARALASAMIRGD